MMMNLLKQLQMNLWVLSDRNSIVNSDNNLMCSTKSRATKEFSPRSGFTCKLKERHWASLNLLASYGMQPRQKYES
jgi:hypothetical protein